MAAGGKAVDRGLPESGVTAVAPATKHQAQVLEGWPEGATATMPDQQTVKGKPDTVAGMPATKHQRQLLKSGAKKPAASR